MQTGQVSIVSPGQLETQMKLSLHENFLGIRTPVKLADQVLLGIIPIFLIFLLWVFTTSGHKKTINLPEGIFEGWEKSPPPDGTVFSDKVRLTIENCSLKHLSISSEEDETLLLKASATFSLGRIPARDFGNGVRLSLPAGKIVGREKPAAELAVKSEDEQRVTETGELINTTLARIEKKPANTKTPSLLKFAYHYEIVETRIISPLILPSPAEVYRSLPSLWSDRKLPLNVLYSFLRVGAGFVVAFMIVFPLSLLMGTFSKVKALFSPLMLFGGYLPIPALVPLTMCLFGTTEQQKIMFLAIGFAIYLMPLFVKALEEIDNVYLQTGYTLGASKFQMLNKILLPMALPNIYDAMRLGFGIGWGYIILAEMVDMGSHGVGTLILTSQRRGPREDIYLVLIAIVVMAFITDKIWDKVGKKLFPYRSQER